MNCNSVLSRCQIMILKIKYYKIMGFRENLKNELTYQGMLVKELSEKTGIPKRTLDNYLREKGSMPPADYAVRIAKALNTSVEFLVDGITIRNANSISDKGIEAFLRMKKEDQEYFIKLMIAVSRNQ